MTQRKFDVVVWGATGFTGKWVAKHLFENYPQEKLKWAIAGRNPDKLDDVREFVGDADGRIEGILANSNDRASLDDMVATTKVIISTVGPYAYYGSDLVMACAKAGTHYVDLTGEVPWMRDMINRFSTAAQVSGARIVHSCGFDSIPSDMGNHFIQEQSKARFGEYLQSVEFALIKAKGGVSGGTVHSMLNVMEEAVKDKKVRRLMSNPYSLNPDQSFKGPDKGDQRAARFSKQLDSWTAPFIMSAINTRVVRRSNAISGFKYGEKFSYTETMATGKGVKGAAVAASIAAGTTTFGAVALTSPGRKFLGMLLPSQGKGPVVDPDNPGFYIIEFHGKTADGRTLVAEVTGDADPGYGSTSKMLAESAVCLALDDDKTEQRGGFWTPSTAMGDALLHRLETNAGLTFTIKQD